MKYIQIRVALRLKVILYKIGMSTSFQIITWYMFYAFEITPSRSQMRSVDLEDLGNIGKIA